MTDADVFAFSALMRRVWAACDRRADTEDFPSRMHTYFRAFRRFDLADLERGADAWLDAHTKPPKIAEWRAAIPRVVVELPVLTEAEASEAQRVARAGYEASPCGCAACVEAEVSEKPRRYVPDEDATGAAVLARDLRTGRVVTRGHWAHGWALFRWYDARAQFYEDCLARGFRRQILTPRTTPRRDGLTEAGR